MGQKDIQISKNAAQNSSNFHPDFRQEKFESAINEKGSDVIFERSLRCPCKGRNNDALSSCKNCGGSGWIFINPTQTRMLVQSLSLNPQYKAWGAYSADISSVSALPKDKLSYMDRITVLDAESEHSEVLHTNMREGLLYAYTIYDILSIYYIGMFVSDDQKLKKLEIDVDYTFTGRKITLTDKYSSYDQDITFVVRYKHNPQFHVVEMVRDSSYTKNSDGRFESTHLLPIHARAKRADVVKDLENYQGDRILDNSFVECGKELKDASS